MGQADDRNDRDSPSNGGGSGGSTGGGTGGGAGGTSPGSTDRADENAAKGKGGQTPTGASDPAMGSDSRGSDGGSSGGGSSGGGSSGSSSRASTGTTSVSDSRNRSREAMDRRAALDASFDADSEVDNSLAQSDSQAMEHETVKNQLDNPDRKAEYEGSALKAKAAFEKKAYGELSPDTQKAVNEYDEGINKSQRSRVGQGLLDTVTMGLTAPFSKSLTQHRPENVETMSYGDYGRLNAQNAQMGGLGKTGLGLAAGALGIGPAASFGAFGYDMHQMESQKIDPRSFDNAPRDNDGYASNPSSNNAPMNASTAPSTSFSYAPIDLEAYRRGLLSQFTG